MVVCNVCKMRVKVQSSSDEWTYATRCDTRHDSRVDIPVVEISGISEADQNAGADSQD